MAVFPSAARPIPFLLAASLAVLTVHALARGSDAQLTAGFYSASCPTLNSVVRQVMLQAVTNNTRSGAGILRLFFHDCFVSVRSRLNTAQPANRNQASHRFSS
jgi:peroxidase